MKNIIIFKTPSLVTFFMHFRYTEEFNKACSNTCFYLQLGLACIFISGLFQIAMVIMTHVN